MAIVYNEVLYMYYRVQMTEGEIARELRDRFHDMGRKNGIDAVRDIVKVIRKYKPCVSQVPNFPDSPHSYRDKSARIPKQV
jgi:hypothetical protein